MGCFGSFCPVGPLSAIGVLLLWRQASKGKRCHKQTTSDGITGGIAAGGEVGRLRRLSSLCRCRGR
jgi:hypothetical protein